MSEPFLKPAFSNPEESQIRHFRNALVELRKTIQFSRDVNELTMQMEGFINANRQVNWPHHTKSVFSKVEPEKAIEKVLTRFRRYLKELETNPNPESYQDLLDAVTVVETLVDRVKDKR
jgi:hypothetical protein